MNFFLLSLFLLFINFPTEEKCVISGKVSGFPDGSTIYLKEVSSGEIVDSAIIVGNSFHLSAPVAYPPEQFHLFSLIGKRYIYSPLLLGNEKVTIEGDISDFPWNVQVKGSKFQDDVNELQLQTKKHLIKRDSLVNVYFKLSDELKAEQQSTIWDEVRNIDLYLDSITLNYIKSHPISYASIIQLGFMKSKFPKDSTERLFENLSTEIKNSKYGKQLKFYLNSDIVKVGDGFYDFEALNSRGEKLRFSTLRKNYSLLEFTSTYCAPCKQALKELKELYSEHGDSLSIVFFSMDIKKESWLRAIEEDNISWPSLWDGTGYYGQTPLSYNVNSIPTFVLMDEDGKILDIWSGYKDGSIGEQLRKNQLSF